MENCAPNGVGCPFLIIGHRGAPYEEAENTIPAFAAALKQGANALEIDLVMTAEHEVAVFHDRNPNELVSLIRQAGLERQKYVPYLPNLGNAMRVPVEELTLDELRSFYGYALSKGIVKDLVTANEKDPNAYIPTIEEFANWSLEEDTLMAVFLDIKLVPGQEELARIMAQKIDRALSKARYRVFMLTQYESIYAALQTWINQNPQAKNRYLTLDMEEEGALDKRKKLRNKLKKKVKSLALGSTILRKWDNYVHELEEVLDRARRKKDMIYPVVSWTVDDERKLYQLLQMGVDGILTNRPDRLHRLLHRHWKDHSTVAKVLASCFEKSRTRGPWVLCSSGVRLDPFHPIGETEVREWVCKEREVHPRLKDFYGCGGIFDKTNIRFRHKIEAGPRTIVHTSPKGGVEVIRLPSTPGTHEQLVFLEFLQDKCRDGVLNYKCEYQLGLSYFMDGKWTSLPGRPRFKDGFYHGFSVPVGAQKLRIFLEETDDGRAQDSGDFIINLQDGASMHVSAPKNSYKGRIRVHIRELAPLLRKDVEREQVAIEYHQSKCYDGPLNYKCEFRLEVEVMDEAGRLTRLRGGEGPFKDSFLVYADLPKTSRGLKITMKELDEEKVSAQSEIFLELGHGESMRIDSGDGTFQGEVILKFIDYDERTEHSEGNPYFVPHDQADREKKKHIELRMP